MPTLSDKIDKIILRHGNRGVDQMVDALQPGDCRRDAELCLASVGGNVLIGTGFPVNGSFETDGPIGALALGRVLTHVGSQSIFVCAPPLFRDPQTARPNMRDSFAELDGKPATGRKSPDRFYTVPELKSRIKGICADSKMADAHHRNALTPRAGSVIQ